MWLSTVQVAVLFLLVTSANCQVFNDDAANDRNFFYSIAKLKFNFQDILAMYRNVSAEAKTQYCHGICRTPIALWVIQNIVSCIQMERADCPKGLVCCVQKSNMLSSTIKSTAATEIDENYIYMNTPKMDKIPGDSDEE